jgi:hypothetical protein
MPGLYLKRLIVFKRPGEASTFSLKTGIVQECKTSEEEMKSIEKEL